MDIAGSAVGAWGGGAGFLFPVIIANARGLGVSIVVILHVDLPHAPKALRSHFLRDIKVFLVSKFDQDVSKCRTQVG